MFRRFNYRDEQRGALRGYTLYRAPVVRIEGTIYPFGGGLCRRLLSGLGLRLAYEQQAPVNATLAGNSLSTSASAYQAELVLRMARGRFTWQPAIGYYVRQYSVETGGHARPPTTARSARGSTEAGACGASRSSWAWAGAGRSPSARSSTATGFPA